MPEIPSFNARCRMLGFNPGCIWGRMKRQKLSFEEAVKWEKSVSSSKAAIKGRLRREALQIIRAELTERGIKIGPLSVISASLRLIGIKRNNTIPGSIRQRALKAGKPPYLVYDRIHAGWTVAEALSIPKGERRPK